MIADATTTPPLRNAGKRTGETPTQGTAGASTSQRGEQEGFTVTLTPLPGTVPGIIRLRRGLKTLLRSYGLRASWPTPAAKAAFMPAGLSNTVAAEPAAARATVGGVSGGRAGVGDTMNEKFAMGPSQRPTRKTAHDFVSKSVCVAHEKFPSGKY
jgi:hypothetical protein